MRHLSAFRIDTRIIHDLKNSRGVTVIHCNGKGPWLFLDQLRDQREMIEVRTFGKPRFEITAALTAQYGKSNMVLIDEYRWFTEPDMLEAAAIQINAPIIVINRYKKHNNE